jgi:hypothetical protein
MQRDFSLSALSARRFDLHQNHSALSLISYMIKFRSEEETMRRIGLTLTAAVALIACGALADRLQAAPIGPPEGLRAALGSLDIVEKAQVFVWHGRRYCWYDDGWQGPGFYWCGYAKRHGLGWGGGAGWHGWQQGVQPQGGQQQGRRSKGVQQQSVQPKSVAPQGEQQGGQAKGGQPKSGAPQGGQQQGGQAKGGQSKGDQPQGSQNK